MKKIYKNILLLTVCFLVCVSFSGCSSKDNKPVFNENEKPELTENVEEDIPTVYAGGSKVEEMTPEEYAEKWLSDYWVSEGTNYENGGFEVWCEYSYDLENDTDNYSKLDFYIWYSSGVPDSNVAKIETTIDVSALTMNKILIVFDDDTWGNSGKCLLTLNDNNVTCKIYDVVYSGAEWGFVDDEYTLYPALTVEGYTQ